MRLFTETLLNDLSAAEAHEALLRTVPGTALSFDDIEHRCRQLVTWGTSYRPSVTPASPRSASGFVPGPDTRRQSSAVEYTARSTMFFVPPTVPARLRASSKAAPSRLSNASLPTSTPRHSTVTPSPAT
ncbi:hypothetical protein KCQ71_05365 [Ruania sp. N2-46]|uniref:Uncharacterized protein n=1 Tax=Occultella gossypii TaxID=2800820 RepID=A0ABS7S5G8_9MICO|nr:hypothetical protein [Occultella gossypii]